MTAAGKTRARKTSLSISHHPTDNDDDDQNDDDGNDGGDDEKICERSADLPRLATTSRTPTLGSLVLWAIRLLCSRITRVISVCSVENVQPRSSLKSSGHFTTLSQVSTVTITPDAFMMKIMIIMETFFPEKIIMTIIVVTRKVGRNGKCKLTN